MVLCVCDTAPATPPLVAHAVCEVGVCDAGPTPWPPVRVGVRVGDAGATLVLRCGLRLGLEEVFVFDSKSENRNRAVEAVETVSEARAF